MPAMVNRPRSEGSTGRDTSTIATSPVSSTATVPIRTRRPARILLWLTNSPSDSVRADIEAAQQGGVLRGRLAIRAALVNHRTRLEDIDALVAAVLQAGHARTAARESGSAA